MKRIRTCITALAVSFMLINSAHVSNSFFQLYEEGSPILTYASGSWDAKNTIISIDVSGENSPYPWSRFWSFSFE
ncbi:MAG: hypothetical protein JXA96_08130 [Sedimentisphaerales bacterium]|nr:hypothetical protein [Sedimentisphaerales bacterium]